MTGETALHAHTAVTADGAMSARLECHVDNVVATHHTLAAAHTRRSAADEQRTMNAASKTSISVYNDKVCDLLIDTVRELAVLT